jgi:hypothetical protein
MNTNTNTAAQFPHLAHGERRTVTVPGLGRVDWHRTTGTYYSCNVYKGAELVYLDRGVPCDTVPRLGFEDFSRALIERHGRR